MIHITIADHQWGHESQKQPQCRNEHSIQCTHGYLSITL